MRTLFIGLVALIALLGPAAGPAIAQDTTAVSSLAQADPARPADPLHAAVLAHVAALGARTRGQPEQDWLAQLGRVYANREGRPFWLRQGALNEEARAAIDEISAARVWGLDPKAFDLPSAAIAAGSADDLASAEVKLSLAVARYAWHARGGRVDPSQLSKWLDQRPRPVDAVEVVASVAGASSPVETLRGFHPSHPQFEALRQAYLKATGLSSRAPAAAAVPTSPPAPEVALRPETVFIPDGPRLRPGDRHPDIALIRKRLGVPVGPDGDIDYDDRLAEAVLTFRREAGLRPMTVINEWVRAALNKAGRLETTSATPSATAAPQGKTAAVDLKRLLVNMERWRWMPEELGAIHIWNNLPEFETRVFKAGSVIHQERIIIGKPENQTPVFSDRVRYVVFQPEWGVPATIKVKDLLPALQNGDDDILDRKDMRIVVNGKTRDPGDFNWDKVDIRNVPIVQDAGSSNPLGQMKFMFPNRHDVYMHDTPKKGLFNSAQRTFSFGCIRVRNPRKLAELVFSEDQGWSPSEVADRIDADAPNSRVDLKRSIPVHNVYFTVVAAADGTLRSFADVYGHDRRIREALDGRPIAEIAEEDPALKLERALEEIAPRIQSAGSAPVGAPRDNGRSSRAPQRGGGRNPSGYLN